MSVTPRASVTTANGSGTSPSLSKPAGTATGDQLCLIAAFRGGTGVTCTRPDATWTNNVLWRVDNGTDNVSIEMFTRAIDGTEGAGPYGLTLSSSQSYCCMLLALTPDTSPAVVVDFAGQSNTQATSCTAPSVTPSSTNDLIIYCAAIVRNTAAQANTCTPPTNYTEPAADVRNTSTTAAGNLNLEVATRTAPNTSATGTVANSFTNLHRSVGVQFVVSNTATAPTFPILNLPQNTLVRM